MEITVHVLLPEEASLCASFACSSAIGVRYGLNEARLSGQLLKAMQTGNDIVIVAALGDSPVGFAWIDPKGAFSSAPYLRLIAVDENAQGSGIGSKLLREFEKRTAGVGRDFCLLVSDFNKKAIAFYESHGYKKSGLLPDFAIQGITEILMVKSRREWKETGEDDASTGRPDAGTLGKGSKTE